ncbi:hypothetical protein Bca4012_000524 [Brassica carinata]
MQRFIESVNWYWKETWKLKGKLTSSWLLVFRFFFLLLFCFSPLSFVDDKEINDDRISSIEITFGKEKEAPRVGQYPMINWKSSIDVMDRWLHLFFAPKCAVRANYSFEYPKDDSHELEIEYLRLEHWILKLKFPLDQSPERTYTLSAIPRWAAFSLPFEITLKGNEKNKTGEKIKRSATASCKVNSPHLSASTSWEEDKIKCSFQHEDGDLLYTSEGLLDFKDAELSLCSVALRKKIDESKGIQVAFDTNNTTTIDFSYRVDNKFKFEVCAKVNARDINHSQIKASFTYE